MLAALLLAQAAPAAAARVVVRPEPEYGLPFSLVLPPGWSVAPKAVGSKRGVLRRGAFRHRDGATYNVGRFRVPSTFRANPNIKPSGAFRSNGLDWKMLGRTSRSQSRISLFVWTTGPGWHLTTQGEFTGPKRDAAARSALTLVKSIRLER